MAVFLTDERRARSLAKGPGVIETQLRILRAHRQAAQPQSVQFGFATNEQRNAEQIAAVLNQLGHHVEAKPATGHLAPRSSRYLEHETWVVGGRSAPLITEEAALSEWVAAMQALGETHDCVFSHWRWPAPDLLARNDDYCLTVDPFDGHLDLTMFRWTAATEAALVEHAVDCVSPGRGVPSLKALAPHAHQIKKLRSPSDEISLADLPLLSELEEIWLPSAPPVHGDYRQLTKLKTFSCLDAETLSPQLLQNPGLQRLRLYRPRKLKSLNLLAACSQLQSLHLRGAPLANLAGIEAWRQLNTLSLVNCRSLSDISALRSSDRLEVLEVFKCPKLTMLQGVEGLRALRWVFMLDVAGPFDSFGALRHWPHLESAELLLPATTVDWAALAGHREAARIMLDTQPGFKLPDEAELRRIFAAQGRQVRSLQLYPKGDCPAVEVTFESPYWHLPQPPAGHNRTAVS
ncbi:leucine-rich repeat domain-containing protein [Ideonella azotifigens]|uniref:Uncharacterized protein n=2 Tax=Ideonella azotifigens TaxID=513160 RepID=A0ABP3VS57_9BURK|nr:leucine-rich repeat domain-containing protein [Ideonella azotifigens]MCD2340324.1 leucine-rich repeat domain-containing protein [Ideonella azotifigens]